MTTLTLTHTPSALQSIYERNIASTMEPHATDKEMLGRRSTDEAQLTDDPERLAVRRRSFHSKVLIGGLVVTVVLGLGLGLGLGLTVGRYRSS